MFSLITPEFTESIAKVLTIGAKKYEPYNWQRDLDTDRIISALHRHLNAYQRGEKLDPETGESHLTHKAANTMFLFWYDNVKPLLDNAANKPQCQSCMHKPWFCRECQIAPRRHQ
jgi:hypothetical protein